MENPEQRPLERFFSWLGIRWLPDFSGVNVLQGSPYPQLVDKLGNFI